MAAGADQPGGDPGVLRAYARYMRQAAFTFSLTYMEQTLATYPKLARALFELILEECQRTPAPSSTLLERLSNPVLNVR